jgi:hypothetical protein
MAQTHTRLGRTLTCTRCLVSGFVILATLWTLSACFNASLTTAVEQANPRHPVRALVDFKPYDIQPDIKKTDHQGGK